jgi:hypothetical protein
VGSHIRHNFQRINYHSFQGPYCCPNEGNTNANTVISLAFVYSSPSRQELCQIPKCQVENGFVIARGHN